jgi:hypothetical protein
MALFRSKKESMRMIKYPPQRDPAGESQAKSNKDIHLAEAQGNEGKY